MIQARGSWLGVSPTRRSPFPYFGGKSPIADYVWSRLGNVKHYIEPFCGSAALLLAAPRPANLEVIGDLNFYVANFWRALRHQPSAVALYASEPAVHVELHARHAWLRDPDRCNALRDALQDVEWPGDARVAGWWAWGASIWIGSGWCDGAQVPHVSDAGRGVRAKVPHVSDAGHGVRAPHADDRISAWLDLLSARLRRVTIVNAEWQRCLNLHYGTFGGGTAAVVLDPPYKGHTEEYGAGVAEVAAEVEEWARENAAPNVRIALCGLEGDYDLPGWDVQTWRRPRNTYAADNARHSEAIWFSPACLPHDATWDRPEPHALLFALEATP